MDALSLDKLQVLIDIPYKGIEKLECKEKVNEHAELFVRITISDETAIWFEKHSLCDRQLKILLDPERPDQITGDILYTQWGTMGKQNYVDIKACSGTKRMDVIKKKVCFQQVDVTYGKFLRKLVEGYHGACLLMDESKREESIKNPIIQYCETDWELAKRIAAQLNTVIFTDNRLEFPRFSLGRVRGKEYELITPTKLKKVLHTKGRCLQVTTWENYPVGASVRAYGETYTVLEKHTVLRAGLIEFNYCLGDIKSYIPRQKDNKALCGVSLRGSVLKVQGERMKLKLEAGDKEKISQLYSYLYLPVSGNSMYAMPEEGAEVELYFPTSDIKDAYIRNCFLPKKSYPDSSIKFFGTSRRKILEMNKEHLLWHTQSNGNRHRIELRKSVGATISSGSKISMTAGTDIVIRAGTSCKINTTGVIELEQTETINSIQMSGNHIRMSAEHYVVSSDPPAGRKKRLTGSDFIMTDANQCVLAAIPMQECGALAMQVIGAIPQILYADSMQNIRVGLFRSRQGG